jgi:hypothetical protein
MCGRFTVKMSWAEIVDASVFPLLRSCLPQAGFPGHMITRSCR